VTDRKGKLMTDLPLVGQFVTGHLDSNRQASQQWDSLIFPNSIGLNAGFHITIV